MKASGPRRCIRYASAEVWDGLRTGRRVHSAERSTTRRTERAASEFHRQQRDRPRPRRRTHRPTRRCRPLKSRRARLAQLAIPCPQTLAAGPRTASDVQSPKFGFALRRISVDKISGGVDSDHRDDRAVVGCRPPTSSRFMPTCIGPIDIRLPATT